MVRSYDEPLRMAFSGRVSFIEWESRNHLMPLIEITRESGDKVKFHNTRIVLDGGHLKVGDVIEKESGSKMCTINGNPIRCIR